MRPLLALLLSLGACSSPLDTGPTQANPSPPSVERVGSITVLRVAGTPYEMGFAHGELLREGIEDGADYIEDSELALLQGVAHWYGLLDQAREQSNPEVLDECQGMVDAYGDEEEWSMDRCLLLAYGDVVLERLSQEVGCTQFVASGAATADGTLMHGRNLDWSEVTFMVENPTLIVRHPEGGVPWVAFGFPGNISPYNGVNALGLSFASNEAHGRDDAGQQGPGHNQMAHHALAHFGTLAEVESYLLSQPHASASSLVFADGDEGDARVFELAVSAQASRALDAQGLVYATNHFVEEATAAVHKNPSDNSSARWARLEQLLEPEGPDTIHGNVDVQAAVAVLRDTTHATDGTVHDPALFDGGDTIANNGAIQSLVMQPGAGRIWVASGAIPVPQRAFTGFTLDWLFGEVETNEVDPAEIPAAL